MSKQDILIAEGTFSKLTITLSEGMINKLAVTGKDSNPLAKVETKLKKALQEFEKTYFKATRP